jgi:hypothetical protein
MLVSSTNSRIAPSLGVSPSSTCPDGIDHTFGKKLWNEALLHIKHLLLALTTTPAYSFIVTYL